MNWKTTYALSIVTIIISLALMFFNLYNYGIYSNIFGNVYTLVKLFIFFSFINILDKSLKTKTIQKNLKVFEYILYVFIVLHIISAVSLIFQFITRPTLFLHYQLIISLIAILLVIYCGINGFLIRKKVLEKYNAPQKAIQYSTDVNALKTQTYKTIDDRLSLCKRCLNKTFDSKTGLICSLNNSKPSFDTLCTDFNINEAEVERLDEIKTTEKPGFFGSWKGALVMSFLGFARFAMRGLEDPFGLVFLALGIGWLVVVFTQNKD
jgi:hypothetical protein